jgi:hypothetical protein
VSSMSRFESLEIMCQERAAVAKKEMEYWQAEAEEWKRLKESSDAFMEGVSAQLDWCTELERR